MTIQGSTTFLTFYAYSAAGDDKCKYAYHFTNFENVVFCIEVFQFL